MLQQSWQRILSHIDALQGIYSQICNAPEEGIALFGAGAIGTDAVRYLKNRFQIKCVIDNSPQKQGTVFEGMPVVSLTDPLVKSISNALITSRYAINEISSQLQESGVNNISFLAFYVLDNIDKYEEIRNNVFVDDTSRTTLDGLLIAMLTGDFRYCTEVMINDQYFCLPHFQNVGEDYFVDAGAYVGDTTEKFIWGNCGVFKHIYLFEPGKLQFQAMQRRMERLASEWAFDSDSISMVNAGVAGRDGTACFGTSSSQLVNTAIIGSVPDSVGHQNSINIWSLDSYLMKGDKPATFIKADIEGMEVEMLRGSANIIKRHCPKLAISVYHHPWDLFAVIETVTSIVPEYIFSLRHHSTNLSETVLYGWVESKR